MKNLFYATLAVLAIAIAAPCNAQQAVAVAPQITAGTTLANIFAKHDVVELVIYSAGQADENYTLRLGGREYTFDNPNGASLTKDGEYAIYNAGGHVELQTLEYCE